MEFFKKLFKGSSCGCNKTHKRSGNRHNKRSGSKRMRMRGGYQFSLTKNSADKIVSLSSHRLSSHRLSKKRSKSNQPSKSKKRSHS